MQHNKLNCVLTADVENKTFFILERMHHLKKAGRGACLSLCCMKSSYSKFLLSYFVNG